MQKRRMADLLLIFITLTWGSTFVLMKNILDTLSTFELLSLRFTSALIVLLIIFHKKLKYINFNILKYGSLIGLMLCASLVFQVYGLYYTQASNSSFITSLNVLLVPILSAIFFKKKVNRSSVVGIVFALAGMFFLTGGLNFKFGIGEFLTFLCALCIALQILFIDKFTQNYDAILLGIVQIGFSALCCSLGWVFVGGDFVKFNSNIIVMLIVVGILGTALAFTGQTYVQKFTSPTHTALIFSLEPVFGLLFALIVPNNLGKVEALTVNKVIGCFGILLGVIISEMNLFKVKDNKKI